MKKRSLLLLLSFIILFIVTSKYNSSFKDFFLDFINPIKVGYLHLTNLSSSYLKQQENIVKLRKENNKLKKILIEQSNYIEQLSKIYKLLPSLAKKPYKSIYIVDTISYVKLNRLDEVVLTTPKEIAKDNKKIYGLIQNDVTAGIVEKIGNKLYAYLLSHPKSTFGVTIGTHGVHGIAQGNGKKGMIVKFIPRWSKIAVGDIARTSGLDNIFFPNIPVGRVTNIQTLDQYKQATIKIYANLTKPSTFFLISDPTPYLTTNYTPKTSFPHRVYPYIKVGNSSDTNNTALQTKEKIIDPGPLDEQEYLKLFNSGYIWDTPLELDKK